jgi:hypothetical protein
MTTHSTNPKLICLRNQSPLLDGTTSCKNPVWQLGSSRAHREIQTDVPSGGQLRRAYTNSCLLFGNGLRVPKKHGTRGSRDVRKIMTYIIVLIFNHREFLGVFRF